MPYLVRNASGSCFVEYRAFNPATNRLERFRIYKGFAKLSGTHLQDHAKEIIDKYSKKLKAGWRPWKEEDVVYQDNIEYYFVSQAVGNIRKDSNHLRRHQSEYLNFVKSDVGKKTFQDYTSKIRQFTFWLEKKGHLHKLISEIDNAIILMFFNHLIQERKLDMRTVSKYHMVLAAMFKYFQKKKVIIDNPVHDTPKGSKTVDKAARPFFEKHIKVYMKEVAKAEPDLFLASLFQYFLLCRPGSELRLMRVQDVDVTRQIVYIRDDTAKVIKRTLTLPKSLITFIEAFKIDSFKSDFYIFGRNGVPGPEPYGKNYFNRRFKIHRDKLNLPRTYTFYSFKHTGAGNLLETGATLAELMSQLGHVRFESTIHYVRRHFGEKSEKILNQKPGFLKGIS